MNEKITILFSKMHGLGNDYIIIDEFNAELIPEEKKKEVAERLCHRRFSIGADGVIFVAPSELADARFRIFNSDGSEAEMCGNGIRCFAKFIYENGICSQKKIRAETLGGIKELELHVKNGEVISIRVDMGTASFRTQDIPMIADVDEFLNQELQVNGKDIKMTVLSVGNPHAVIFTENLDSISLNKTGPAIENHSAFPNRVNVHFVNIISPTEIEMITWERGVGHTPACGTGAMSSVLAGYRLGLLDPEVYVHLPGGDLVISVYKDDENMGAYMEGECVQVFDGIMEIEI